jgi:hypothetical protein
LEDITNTAVDALGFREQLLSIDPNKYVTLIDQLGSPVRLSELSSDVAGLCLRELGSFLKSETWRGKVCLVDCDTGDILHRCNVRAAGHIGFLKAETGESCAIGFGKNGIFVRRLDKSTAAGRTVLLPTLAYVAEMALINSHDYGHFSSLAQAKRSVRFRSVAVEQTQNDRGRFRSRDLKTGKKAFAASIGYQVRETEEAL